MQKLSTVKRAFARRFIVISLLALTACSQVIPSYDLASDIGETEWANRTILSILDRQRVEMADLETYLSENAESKDPKTLAYVGLVRAFGYQEVRDYWLGLEQLEAACELGEQRACRSFARTVLFEGNPDRDTDLAYGLLETSCQNKIYMACQDLAIIYGHNAETSQHIALAIDYARQACEARTEKHCTNAAYAVRGIAPDTTKALLDAACQPNNLYGCHFRAMHAYGAAETDEEIANSIGLLDETCAAGVEPSCDHLFWGMVEKSFYSERLFRSEKVALRSCRRGNAGVCARIAFYYQVPEIDEMELSFETAKLGCDAGDLSLCSWTAHKYADGSGVEQNTQEAVSRFERLCKINYKDSCKKAARLQPGFGDMTAPQRLTTMCDRGDAESCRSLAWSYAIGKDTGRDPENAAKYFSRACDLGAYWGCLDMASLNDWGEYDFEEDKATAKIYYRKACDLGNEKGCELAVGKY